MAVIMDMATGALDAGSEVRPGQEINRNSSDRAVAPRLECVPSATASQATPFPASLAQADIGEFVQRMSHPRAD